MEWTLWSRREEGVRDECGTHFNTKAVANMPIPIPSLAEQHRIVARVDALIAEVLDPATAAEMGRWCMVRPGRPVKGD